MHAHSPVYMLTPYMHHHKPRQRQLCLHPITTAIDTMGVTGGWSDDAMFVDIGSGMGKAVVCAAITGMFGRCVGVEVSMGVCVSV